MRFKNTYYQGIFTEFLARMFLRLHGFRIVKTRHITGRNTQRAEIDIIAKKHNLLIFIEVKSRPTIADGLVAITPRQAVRLRRAAETFISQTGWRGDARFDAIVVCGWRVHWHKNAI